MEKSIYNLILDNIVDGRLREGFSLHEDNGTGEPVFADGALDGITLYHFGQSSIDAAGKRKMIKALNAANRDEREAEKLFAELAENYSAVGIVDAFQRYIMDHRRRLSARVLKHTAFYMIYHSTNVECVKYGLEILELMADIDEQGKTAIRRLGLCDEFSAQAVWIFSRLDGGNDEIFNLAKNLSGWGRIHAVAALKPETPEIRRWLLFEGINNYVMPQYSALAVWVKAGVGELLKSDITDEEFHAVSKILGALLDEGPAEGISGLDDAEEAVRDYLAAAVKTALAIEDYESVFDIRNWAADESNDYPEIVLTCSDILSDELCEETVREAVKEGKGLRLAEALEIYSPEEEETNE